MESRDRVRTTRLKREPFGDYGIRKAEIERFLLEAATRGFPATVLHPGHITGPGSIRSIPPAISILRFSIDSHAAKSWILPDDGMATLQHVHADDVAQVFELAIDQPSNSIGESFHVAAREPVTMRSYAEAAAAWWGRAANLRFLPFAEWEATVSDYDAALTRDHAIHSPCASIEKARRVLGFEPRFTAVEAVRDALRSSLPTASGS